MMMIFALCLLLALSLLTRTSAFGFDFFSRTNQGNVTLPSSQADAAARGWQLARREDGSPCREDLGFEYTEGADTHSRARPLSLFFNAAGQLSGLSVRAWFESDTSFNPLWWQQPAFGADADGGSRWVTVSTRAPAEACSQAAAGSVGSASGAASTGDLLGDRLAVNGGQLLVPTEAPADPQGAWKRGACMANMSQHWGYPLDGQESSLLGPQHGTGVLPINPMYSVPAGSGHGRVTALAFFTTEPQLTQRDGGVWDASGTPAQLCAGNYCVDAKQCEFGASNSVFHVFFVDQWAAEAQCEPVGSPGC